MYDMFNLRSIPMFIKNWEFMLKSFNTNSYIYEPSNKKKQKR